MVRLFSFVAPLAVLALFGAGLSACSEPAVAVEEEEFTPDVVEGPSPSTPVEDAGSDMPCPGPPPHWGQREWNGCDYSLTSSPAQLAAQPCCHVCTVPSLSIQSPMDAEALGDCESLSGLHIGETTSLAGLERLKSVERLRVTGSRLDSLAGMASLAHVEYLEIEGSGLKSVGITSSAGTAVIKGNPNLTEVGGELKVLARVDVEVNENLETLVGLTTAVVSVGVSIVGNPRLSDLRGLENLRGGGVRIERNASLQTLDGLHNLTRGGVAVLDNYGLVSLAGLERLESAGLFVSGNARLTSLNGLDSLGEAESIKILDNAQLTDVAALESVRVTDRMYVNRNPQLRELTADGVVELYDLQITENDSLESIRFGALEDVYMLIVRDNGLLPQCLADQIAVAGTAECRCEGNDDEAVCEEL